MARDSVSRDALASYLPESVLIRRRHAWALAAKYQARAAGDATGRLREILDVSGWTLPDTTPTKAYEAKKFLGCVTLEHVRHTSFGALDDETGARIRFYDKDALELHVDKFKGAGQFREGMGMAAHYISAHPHLGDTPYVAGMTYAGMASFARAIGFRSMKLERCEKGNFDEVAALHEAYCAMNGIDRPFQPAVVYLPTPDFVETFSPYWEPGWQDEAA